METSWRVVEDDLSGAEIRALLQLHFDGMAANSPPGSCHFLDFEGLRSPDVTFWSVWDGASLAGCGALREIARGHGEVKSMRTAPEHLGRGVGSVMIDHIVAVARARGYERLSLETGSSESFAAAHRLYARVGFEPCGPFGTYTDDPFSRYYTLVL
jgi:putative acetyltransferase